MRTHYIVDMKELSMSKFLGINHKPIYLGVYLIVFYVWCFFYTWFFLIGNYSMKCGELNGKETQKRRDVCTHTADSLWCTAETIL